MDALIRLEHVKARTGLSRSSIYAKAARNEFPKPISLGQRAVAWVESEVSDWIQARITNSRKAGE